MNKKYCVDTVFLDLRKTFDMHENLKDRIIFTSTGNKQIDNYSANISVSHSSVLIPSECRFLLGVHSLKTTDLCSYLFK